MNGPAIRAMWETHVPTDELEQREDEALLLDRIAAETITGPPDSTPAAARTPAIPTVVPEPQPQSDYTVGQKQAMRGEQERSAETKTNCGPVTNSGSPEPGLHGEALAAWDIHWQWVEFVCGRAGLKAEEGERQTWPVLGGEVAVVLAQGTRGFFFRVVGGWPSVPAPRSLSLTQVLIIATCGKLRGHRKKGEASPELALWKRRGLMQAGLVAPGVVSLPPLPASASPSALLVWGLIEALVRVRRRVESPGTPLPLARKFLVDFFAGQPDVTEQRIRQGLSWLQKQGFIEHVGDAPGHPDPTKLWRIVGEVERQP